MGIIKLLERAILGRENIEVREEIRDMKRKQESEAAKKEILAAHQHNMRISAKTRKIQKECWKKIKELREQYPQIFGHVNQKNAN